MTLPDLRIRFLLVLACWMLHVQLCDSCCAHGFHSHPTPSPRSESTTKTDSEPAASEAEASRSKYTPANADAFKAFMPSVNAFRQGNFLVVESDGLPVHGMMVGIRAWQQQVPLPQPFQGENAWRLPLEPKPASKPISVLEEPLRGAIALAVNGVPIFCALNNRGEDTFLAGELDRWGGHCGRGDDYHYHTAPLHLESKVGVGQPIAFALDGYPIIGLTERDGTDPVDLDPFNGHTHDGMYHYHASNSFPYVNGGLHGEVQMQGDQILQPRDAPFRPGQSPLRGATITEFTRNKNDFQLTYEVRGEVAKISYRIDDERVQFEFMNPDGTSSTEVYSRGSSPPSPVNRIWLTLGCVLTVAVVAVAFRSLVRRKSK